jgi:hypothetical protein
VVWDRLCGTDNAFKARQRKNKMTWIVDVLMCSRQILNISSMSKCIYWRICAMYVSFCIYEK